MTKRRRSSEVLAREAAAAASVDVSVDGEVVQAVAPVGCFFSENGTHVVCENYRRDHRSIAGAWKAVREHIEDGIERCPADCACCEGRA